MLFLGYLMISRPEDFSSGGKDGKDPSLRVEFQVTPTAIPSSNYAVIGLNDCGNSRSAMGLIAFQAPSGVSSASLGLEERLLE